MTKNFSVEEYDAVTTACAYTAGGLATASSTAMLAGVPRAIYSIGYLCASIAATVGYYFSRERRIKQDKLYDTKISGLERKVKFLEAEL
jgi:hypothetical protein